MQNQTLRKFRWFWAWQDDKEEAWLEEMSCQGWHLAKIEAPTIYRFSKGEAQDYVYRLDYISTSKKTEDYLQLFRDAGWEHVETMSGWQYFRKLPQAGEQPEIYSDADSKIKKYQRLLAFLFLMLGMLVLIYISVLSRRSAPYPDLSSFYFCLKSVYITLFVVYIFSMIKLWLRIRELRRL